MSKIYRTTKVRQQAIDTSSWMDRAACRRGTGVDPKLFEEAPGPSGREAPAAKQARLELELQRVRKALAICRACPVTNECYQDAIDYPYPAVGVRGGFDFSNTAEKVAKESRAA